MLTHPSDLLPQIVCPMDEDAIPPNPFCSAPPHNEPPPPLLPLSSTLSFGNNGTSGHARSGRIQGIRGQKPKKTDSSLPTNSSKQYPSSSKRQGESAIMVSQSKQLKVENAQVHQKQNKDEFDVRFTTEQQNSHEDQTNSWKETQVSAEDVVEQTADITSQNPDNSKSDLVSFRGLAMGHNAIDDCPPKGWDIGPLFQSLKSKMASFTEMVMSPVKIFRSNSMDQALEEMSDNDPRDMFEPMGQSENTNQSESNLPRLSHEGDAQHATTSPFSYSRKLAFDVDGSKEAEECAITRTDATPLDSVPSQDIPGTHGVSESNGSLVRPSVLSQPCFSLSASHEVSSKTSSAVEERGEPSSHSKPLRGRRAGNRPGSKVVITTPSISETEMEQLDSFPSKDANATPRSSSTVSYAYIDTDGLESGHDINNIKSCRVTGGTVESTLNTQHPERPIFPVINSAAGAARSKRGVTLSTLSQETSKKKRLRGRACNKELADELIEEMEEGGPMGELMPPMRDIVPLNNHVEDMVTQKPLRKRQAAPTKSKKRGIIGQEMLPVVTEDMSGTLTETFPTAAAALVCSVDKSSDMLKSNSRSSSSKVKPRGSGRRNKTTSNLVTPDGNFDSTDSETATAVTSTGQAELEPLSKVFIHPDEEQLQSTSKCRNTNKKPLKRKSPIQASSFTDIAPVSDSSLRSVSPFELTPTDDKTLVPVQRSLKTELCQSTKRPKKAFKGAVVSPQSSETQDSKECIANSLSTNQDQTKCKDSSSTSDPVYFEMTPFESSRPPHSSSSSSPPEAFTHLNNESRPLLDNGLTDVFTSVMDASNNDGSAHVPRARAGTRGVKPRRADAQRRKCIVLRSRTRKCEEMSNSVTMEDANLTTGRTRSSENVSSRSLSRSYSCPEIPSLHTSATSPLHLPHPSRTHFSLPPSHTPPAPHSHKFLRRARRHTVCSLEVAREIAPRCLRKEVYPARRSASYDGPAHFHNVPLSPSNSFSALASCFLSSPLAFLSKRGENRGAAGNPGTSCRLSSPSALLASPVSSSSWHLSVLLHPAATSDSIIGCSGDTLVCDTERIRQINEEDDDDGEDTSSSSQEYEDVTMREEKSLSDSEIKVQKHEERGKVSSIRIRKTLPKPQNNLTPMGLPKAVRVKKKQFSLEEIYTNKNFSKPPESRLETIFEVPLNRRNGSESWFGQRRFKRFLEFLELGEVRKPKKPLVGIPKVAASSSRTRRGGFQKEAAPLSAQDVDSLLCAKLDQLNLWLMHDQADS